METAQKSESLTTIKDEEFFTRLRKQEFARIDDKKHCYLDFTGGNLYPISILTKHFDYLKADVYGNPHSVNPTSLLSTKNVEQARQDVISFFNAQDYECVFTPNASGALHIVGECYPFDEEACFLLLADNHNSVNGIREYCRQKGGNVKYSLLNIEDLKVNRPSLEKDLNNPGYAGNKLFAFPAQSNVSGIKHDLSWIAYAKDRGWDVLLDAAAFVPTSPLNLKDVQPDFVSVSFYKIFGYPTGIGCLLIKKDKFHKLKKPSFAGGTVTWVSVQAENYALAENHERFENGTINYADIPAISLGLQFIKSIGINRINARVKALSQYIIQQMKSLKHSNGNPLVKIYGTSDLTEKGGTLIVNFLDKAGQSFPPEEIEASGAQRKISFRTGCFCNPGLDEINHCLTNKELSSYFTSRDTYSYQDMYNFLGRIRGAIRISFGVATIKKDLDRFIDFVLSYRNETAN